MKPSKYKIKHRKQRKVYMVYEDQVSWMARNKPQDMKSESEFICHLLALGIQSHTKFLMEVENV